MKNKWKVKKEREKSGKKEKVEEEKERNKGRVKKEKEKSGKKKKWRKKRKSRERKEI